MDRKELGYDEGDAKRILQRAAALDARIVGRLSVEEIRSVAHEAGISETAVSMALAEATEGVAPPQAPSERMKAFLDIRLRGLSALGGLFGFLAGAIAAPHYYESSSTAEVTIIAGVLLALSIIGAARAVKVNRFSAYRIINGLMWIAFGVGYTLVQGRPDDVATVTGAGWVISTAISTLLVGIKLYLSSPAPSNDEMKAAAGA